MAAANQPSPANHRRCQTETDPQHRPVAGVGGHVLLLDQFTKTLILGYYQLGDSTPVTSFFNVVRVHNHGAAFSFLANAGGWQRWLFTGIGVVAAIFMVWMLKSHPGQKLFAFAVSSLLGGAVGNVVDRLMHGYVVDFLDFHWKCSPRVSAGPLSSFQCGRRGHHAGCRLSDRG